MKRFTDELTTDLRKMARLEFHQEVDIALDE